MKEGLDILYEFYGGPEELNEAIRRRMEAIDAKWNQDAETIGRILRAHLFVEHFLTRYLQFHNPNLPDLDEVRLGFAQEVALLGTGKAKAVDYLIGGLKLLNKVRNRLAHTLKGEVTEKDSQEFLSIDLFRFSREFLARPNVPSDKPICVLEDFAKHAGHMLENASHPDKEVWNRAFAVKGPNDKAPTAAATPLPPPAA